MTKDNEITALGEFDKKFKKTYELFKKNLENNEEVGASFAVYQNGEVLVDLYGGYRDRDKSNKWDQNTIVNIHSTSKGISLSYLIVLYSLLKGAGSIAWGIICSTS